MKQFGELFTALVNGEVFGDGIIRRGVQRAARGGLCRHDLPDGLFHHRHQPTPNLNLSIALKGWSVLVQFIIGNSAQGIYCKGAQWIL